MRTKHLVIASVVIGALGLAAGALPAADTKPFTIDGINYTKWLWGTQRGDGSLYNFTTIPGEGYGDNGQGTELELLVSAKPSSKIEVSGRMKARFSQNFWTNFGGFGGGGAGAPGSGDCISGDCGEFDSRSAQYVKFRGLTITITPGYNWVDTVTIGSSNFGMFDPWTIGAIRYIDRDNGAGLIFQGAFADRKVGYDFVRISLPRLWAGPSFNTGDYNVQDAGYGLQLRFNPDTPVFDGAFIYSWVNDVEIDPDDPDFDDGRDLESRNDNQVWGVRLGVHPTSMFDIRAAFYSSDSETDPRFAPSSFFGISGFDTMPAGDLSDEAWYVDFDINDPFDAGVSFNLQFFDIGADYVSTLAARRESDVLLTEGHDSAYYYPGPDNSAFGVFAGNPTRMGIGGWQGTAQQMATINVDNEFTDFDEVMAETAIGWKGFTLLVPWSVGDLDLSGEYTYVDYNTNWQAWGRPNYPILESIYPNAESDAGIGSFRNAYAPFQDRETEYMVLKGKYYFDVGNGLELFGKLKWIDETDDRMTDPRFLPYEPGDCPTSGALGCANVERVYGFDADGNPLSVAALYGNPSVITNAQGETGYQWKPFDSVRDDDKDLDYFMFVIGASYQLTDELWGSLSWESYDVDLLDGNTAFQAYQLHQMASGEHEKDKYILILKYNIGGAEIGFNYEYNEATFKPNFGGGFVTQFASEDTASTFGLPVGSPGFSGRFGGWNTLLTRDLKQERLKAFLKLRF
jgi:hypothetical protein